MYSMYYSGHDTCSCTRCIENNIHILLLPAHTTHILQVADISIFGPFKKYLATAFVEHRCSDNTQINNSLMARLTHRPFVRATAETNVAAGFAKAGIHPFNPDKITAAIYKSGIQHRGLQDDTATAYPPPAPPLPALSPAPSSSASVSPPASEPHVETVESVLHVPPARARSDPSMSRKRKLDTTYAVMVTEHEHVDALRAYRQQKEKEEKEKAERKIQRTERHAEILRERAEKEERKKERQKKKSPRLRGKENITPNIPQPDIDPYEFNPKLGHTAHSRTAAKNTSSNPPSLTQQKIKK
jgi:hypothetical protein